MILKKLMRKFLLCFDSDSFFIANEELIIESFNNVTVIKGNA